MNEQERELDLMVAELEQENRLLRARNERLEREALAKQPAQDQRPFCYHDGRNIVGKEFAHHSDVFPLYTAPQPEQQDWEAIAADQAMTIAMLKSEQPAQPPQEPVAWLYDWISDGHEGETVVTDWVSADYDEAHSPTMGCHNIRPLYTSPPAQRKPLGFAGVTVWVGDAVATQIVTEVAIQCERIPSQSITMAAQRCVDMLAAHGIKAQP